MNKNVKTNLHNHSEAKVQLFGEYLQKYLNIISNNGYTEKIHLYDLFCSQGIYENGGEGSPIVALRKIKNTYFSIIQKNSHQIPKINCYFNDIDSSKINKLKKSIKKNSLHYEYIGDLKLTSNDYISEVEKLSKYFKKLKNEKAFIFIDPYGYKEVKAQHIKSLLDCKKKSEVLLWLPIQFMYRFSESGTPDVLKNFINELGITDKVSKEDNVWSFIKTLKNGFQNYLGSDFFVDNFSLQKEENTVFCLYFFTSHIKGFEKMLETKWHIDTEQGRGWKYDGNTPTLFFEQKTNALEDSLKIFLSEKNRTNGEIYKFTLRQGYLTTHTNQILRDWQNNSKLDVLLSNGEKARKSAFYNNYTNYRDFPRKVILKLKK